MTVRYGISSRKNLCEPLLRNEQMQGFHMQLCELASRDLRGDLWMQVLEARNPGFENIHSEIRICMLWDALWGAQNAAQPPRSLRSPANPTELNALLTS